MYQSLNFSSILLLWKKALPGCKEFSKNIQYLSENESSRYCSIRTTLSGNILLGPTPFFPCASDFQELLTWGQTHILLMKSTRMPMFYNTLRLSSTLLNMDHSTVQQRQDKGCLCSEPTNTDTPEHPIRQRTLPWRQMHKKSFQALSLLLNGLLSHFSIQIHSFMPSYL